MTRGEQILEEAKRIVAEAHEKGNNDPMVDLAITLSFTLGARWADKNPRWISVEEQDIPLGQWVITYAPNEINYSKIDVEFFAMGETAEDFGITHWMPLLQPPKSGCSEFPNNSKKGGEK